MLLQALVIGRSLIESVRQRSQQQLEAAVQKTFRRHRSSRQVAQDAGVSISAASTSRPRRSVPWSTVFNQERRMHRLAGSYVRGLQSSYHRPASNSANSNGAIEFDEKDFEHVNWKPVYRFDIISLVGRLSRFKMIQTMITIGIGGGAIYANQIGAMSPNELYLATTPVLLAMIFVYAMQYYMTKLVGIISISDDEQFIRVGHMTFWGRRKNIILPLEDVLPLDETKNRASPLLASFERYSNEKQQLVLPLKRIDVTDEDVFLRIFGNNDVSRRAIEISRATKDEANKKNEQMNESKKIKEE